MTNNTSILNIIVKIVLCLCNALIHTLSELTWAIAGFFLLKAFILNFNYDPALIESLLPIIEYVFDYLLFIFMLLLLFHFKLSLSNYVAHDKKRNEQDGNESIIAMIPKKKKKGVPL